MPSRCVRAGSRTAVSLVINGLHEWNGCASRHRRSHHRLDREGRRGRSSAERQHIYNMARCVGGGVWMARTREMRTCTPTWWHIKRNSSTVAASRGLLVRHSTIPPISYHSPHTQFPHHAPVSGGCRVACPCESLEPARLPMRPDSGLRPLPWRCSLPEGLATLRSQRSISPLVVRRLGSPDFAVSRGIGILLDRTCSRSNFTAHWQICAVRSPN